MLKDSTSIGEELRKFGGYLQCDTCGRRKPLGNVGDKFANGWLECCGYTMRWVTQSEILLRGGGKINENNYF